MITVVTTCYNQAEFLSQAIGSVLNQSYSDFEYILINDGSTDNTNKIMQEYRKKDYRIRVFDMDKQPNVSSVLNFSIQAMKGDFWVWVPSDDLIDKHLLRTKMEESIVSNHDYILYSDFRTINDKGVFQKDTILEYKGPVWFSDEIFKSCPIGFTGVWIPQSILNRVGTFEERLSCCEDYEWMLRAVSLGVPFRKIPKILYSKRHHPDRTTIKEYKNIPSIVDNLRRKYD